jgi:osomolarity two-component system, response regulator SKN7
MQHMFFIFAVIGVLMTVVHVF